MLEHTLADMNLALPTPASAAGSFVGYKRSGNLLFISGQLPLKDGQPTLVGRLGDDVTLEQGYEAARQCALNVLAQIGAALDGRWERMAQVVRLGGFVRCTPDFADAPKVVNGASDLFVQVFGAAGAHSRAAVGVSSLPMNVAVEIEALVELIA